MLVPTTVGASLIHPLTYERAVRERTLASILQLSATSGIPPTRDDDARMLYKGLYRRVRNSSRYDRNGVPRVQPELREAVQVAIVGSFPDALWRLDVCLAGSDSRPSATDRCIPVRHFLNVSRLSGPCLATNRARPSKFSYYVNLEDVLDGEGATSTHPAVEYDQAFYGRATGASRAGVRDTESSLRQLQLRNQQVAGLS